MSSNHSRVFRCNAVNYGMNPCHGENISDGMVCDYHGLGWHSISVTSAEWDYFKKLRASRTRSALDNEVNWQRVMQNISMGKPA